MLKLACVVSVILLCSSAGYIKSYKLKKRYQNLCRIKAALCDVKSRITFFGFDIARALAIAGKIASAEPLFSLAADKIKQKGAAAAWREALDLSKEEMCLSADDIHSLSQLSSRLGMTDCEGQIKNVDGVIALLDTNIADAKCDKDRYCSLYLGGGTLIGIFLGLMII